MRARVQVKGSIKKELEIKKEAEEGCCGMKKEMHLAKDILKMDRVEKT